MKAIVVYASRYGNTHKVAEAITNALLTRGSALLIGADEMPSTLPAGTDLVVIGGPTERHGVTEPVTRMFERLERGALTGIAAAAFDTRLHWPRWMAGSAGAGITRRLRDAGARVLVPEESFFVRNVSGEDGQKSAELDPGELERASAWALVLAEQIEPQPRAASGSAAAGGGGS
jgi:flavodoxin